MVITGGCHCGNTSFELTWEPAPNEIPATTQTFAGPIRLEHRSTTTKPVITSGK